MINMHGIITQREYPFKKIILISLFAIVAVSSLVAFRGMISSDPGIALLSDDNRAKWIRFDKPVNLGIWKDEYPQAFFRRSFSISRTKPPEAILTIRAMKLAEVYLDGRLIAPFSADLEEWKKERVINLGPFLTAGQHELQITVVNKYGPPLLIAHSDALSLRTGEDWDASLDGRNWERAVSAAKKEIPELSRMFPNTGAAMRSEILFLLPVFSAVFFLSFYSRSGLPFVAWVKEGILLPSRVRWVLMGLWVILAINNIFKLPLNLGYDAVNHYEYISYMVTNHRIPLASEGWQMFQSPLYYMISAGFHSVLSGFTNNGNTLNILMRIIPLLCGMLQVEVAYRAMKSVFSTREDLQMLGTVVGGLLPMNIYISQYVGNEPLAGLLSAVAVMMSLRLLHSDHYLISKWYLSALGLVSGLAMLTKATPVLLCPPLALFLLHIMLQRQISKRKTALNLLLVFGIAFAVCGWYYLRNWFVFGKLFVGGWDLTRNIAWWQDPGYRTTQDFLRFGMSLQYPIYAGVNGFWDSIYSTFWMDGFLSSIITPEGCPPWNYGLMISGALLSLLPSAGIILGTLRTILIEKYANKGKVFAVTCIGVYFIALLFMYLKLPIYTTAKATYTLGITPCYALVCVNGLDLIMRNKFMAAFVNAIIICWGVVAYCSFFVV
jgi:4-amino-4-deoxy-L-arabinose transferase-like glycosyltransferase